MRLGYTRIAISGLFVLGVSLLLSCEEAPVPTPPLMASADILNSEGEPIGTAQLLEAEDGVRIDLKVSGLAPGPHGFHIHENGECLPPDFQSAGGHFSPFGGKHGFEVEGGPHAGDLRNLEVPASGEVDAERTVDGVTLSTEGDQPSIVGKAIVIHAEPDDYESQPSGAAGARVACGVIQVGTTPVPTQPYPQLPPRDYTGDNPGRPPTE